LVRNMGVSPISPTPGMRMVLRPRSGVRPDG
jgi:hypothetical protein